MAERRNEKYTIEADNWDFRASDRSLQHSRELTAAQKRIAKKETGAEAFRDLFHSLIKAVPMLKEQGEIDSKYTINRVVLDEMMNMEEFDTMRNMSVGDTVGTGIACVHLEPRLEVLFDKLEKLQEDLKKLEQKRQELQEAQQDEKSPEELIEELMNEVGDLEQEVSEGMEEAGEHVRETMGEAMEELADQAEGEGIAKGWGMSPGELARMDPQQRIALAKKLSTPAFKRMAEVIGRFQNIAISNVEEVHANVYEEIYDVEMGNDFSRLLGSEMVAFGEDLLFYEQAKKFLERSLAQYAIQGVETKNKGSIIYVCDGSGSMSGDREVWAKAIGLALLKVAQIQGRGFTAIQFGGPGTYLRMQYDTSTPETSVEVTQFSNNTEQSRHTKTGFYAIMEFAELGFQGGGTDYVTPMDEAIRIMDAEKVATGAVSADIVFATDDECNVPEEWLKRYRAHKEELAFKVFSFVIGSTRFSTVEKLSDVVLTPKALLDGTDLAQVFKEL